MAGEAFTLGLRRRSVTWWFFDVSAFANPSAPTLAELTTSNARLAKNVTCAIDEGATSFTVGSSELDEALTFCDESGLSRPTTLNPEAAIAIRRDKDRAANGDFAQALAWMLFPDTEYFIVRRIGDQDKSPDRPIAPADWLQIQRVKNDYPVDTLSSGENALLVQNYLQTGFVNWNYVVPAA